MLDKPTTAIETTESILNKLQENQKEFITVHIGTARYLIPVATLKLFTWNAIPDFIKDEHSKEAQEMSLTRVMIKGFIRPMLPVILKKTWGEEVTIAPGLNILSWLPKYFTHYFIAFLSSKDWYIHAERLENNVYKVSGISPNSNDSGDIKRDTASTASDSQSI
jgi:hypothetical protein